MLLLGRPEESPSPVPGHLGDRFWRVPRQWSSAGALYAAVFPSRRQASRSPLCAQPLQSRHFLLRQLPEFPRRNIQSQRPHRHALDLLHLVPHVVKHPPYLPIPPLDQNHLVPGIRRIGEQPHFRRRRFYPPPILERDGYAVPQPLERLPRRPSADLHVVRFRNVRGRTCQSLRQLPIVGQQQQSLARIVQTPDRIQSFSLLSEQFHHRWASLRVARRRDVPLRLVQQQVNALLRRLHRCAVHTNAIVRRVGFRPKLRHGLSIHRDPPCADQLLRLPTRSDSGSSQDFLQSFGHG